MVDSRAKGQRAEYQVRDLFRKHTALNWERVPGSGGFNKSHGLKGDIYVPNANTIHCIEIKSYAEDAINCNLLNDSVSQLEKWWQQTLRESREVNKEPILIFKKDRGKWLLATTEFEIMDECAYSINFNAQDMPPLYIVLLDDWIKIKREYVK